MSLNLEDCPPVCNPQNRIEHSSEAIYRWQCEWDRKLNQAVAPKDVRPQVILIDWLRMETQVEQSARMPGYEWTKKIANMVPHVKKSYLLLMQSENAVVEACPRFFMGARVRTKTQSQAEMKWWVLSWICRKGVEAMVYTAVMETEKATR